MLGLYYNGTVRNRRDDPGCRSLCSRPTAPSPSGVSLSVQMNYRTILASALCVAWLGTDNAIAQSPPVPVPDANSLFVEQVAPFLAKHCHSCHGSEDPEADLSLERFQESANIQEEYALWQRVLRMLEEREMPPADQPQPAEEELHAAGVAIQAQLDSFDCSGDQRPGRVTIRRLNRAEYNNTIRDLVGIDFQPAADFPSDDVGHGFDNIADVLSMSPILLEKYLAAAETVVEQAFENPEARAKLERFTAESREERRETLEKNVRAFAERAFRRPVSDVEIDRLLALVDAVRGSGPERGRRGRGEGGRTGEPPRGAGPRRPSQEALQVACTAILTSPHFLFRIEQDVEQNGDSQPPAGDAVAAASVAVRPLNDYEIATRLSYFLWSSMPDDELFELAAQGELRQTATLHAQVERMLADPKARALVDHFAGQWLQLRDVANLSPDPERYPAFDEELRAAMLQETELFFTAIIREDRSVLDFLSADFTYVNERLAQHYGIAEVQGEEFRRVALPAQRRGVLTHASILLLTSNPTRTSPVKRGQWILDNFLGEPPPPPPPGIEELDDDDETLGSLRERMEQHRANPSCAVCHRQMDALGFGLENFDAIGAWRESDGRFAIDPAGELPGSQRFSGPAELMQVLAEQKREAFTRRLAEKLLTYGLGRGLGPYDRCAVNAILDQAAAEEFRFGALVKAIVTSDPFLFRELKGAE